MQAEQRMEEAPIEVRRRNGCRKAARTLADRILVLTETERRNPGGFVAFSPGADFASKPRPVHVTAVLQNDATTPR
ncbi:MAG TPA: hypothetical protein VGC96_10095 [Candidatus Elarobacter sp.]